MPRTFDIFIEDKIKTQYSRIGHSTKGWSVTQKARTGRLSAHSVWRWVDQGPLWWWEEANLNWLWAYLKSFPSSSWWANIRSRLPNSPQDLSTLEKRSKERHRYPCHNPPAICLHILDIWQSYPFVRWIHHLQWLIFKCCGLPQQTWVQVRKIPEPGGQPSQTCSWPILNQQNIGHKKLGWWCHGKIWTARSGLRWLCVFELEYELQKTAERQG